MDQANRVPVYESDTAESSSPFPHQTLPSYDEATKSPLADPNDAPPPSYAEAIGNSGPFFVSTYPFPPPDGDPEIARTRPICRTNSDFIIVQLLSELANERRASSSNAHRNRPVSVLPTDRVASSQESDYSQPLAKKVQLCFVFIVVAVIIVAGAITTSVIKSTKTDVLSPVEPPTVDIPTNNPDSFHVPKPTYLSYSEWLYRKYNSSRNLLWNDKPTSGKPTWSFYGDKWKEFLKRHWDSYYSNSSSSG